MSSGGGEQYEQYTNRPTMPPSRTWDDFFRSLEIYKFNYGTTVVPDHYHEDPALGRWAAFQRQNRPNLHKRQKEQLDSIGFQFVRQYKSKELRFKGEWEDMFLQLVEYINDKTKGKWPKMIRGNPPLANWVRRQRDLRREGKLSDNKIGKLNRLGMIWKTEMQEKFADANKEQQWMMQYNQLVKFHAEHGHSKVPARYLKDMTLGEWVRTQRKMWKSNKLMDHRQKLLDKLDFIYDATPNEVGVGGRLEAAVNSQQSQQSGRSSSNDGGSSSPKPSPYAQQAIRMVQSQQQQQQQQQQSTPPQYPFQAQPPYHSPGPSNSAANIMSSTAQQQPYHASATPPQRPEQDESSWNAMFQKLRASRLVFGSSSMSGKFQGDSEMGQWVAEQRRAFKYGQLSQERQRKLESIQFVFHTPFNVNVATNSAGKNNHSPASASELSDEEHGRGLSPSPSRKRTWEESFNTLALYKQQHGHCYVPHRYEPDLALGGWVYKMRMQRDSMSPEQRALLESIGFDFESQEEKHERQWDTNFEFLKTLQAGGNFLIRKEDFRNIDGDFQRWVKQQRRFYRHGRLKESRVVKLNSIGFCWEREDLSSSPQQNATQQPPSERKTWIQYYFSLVDFQGAHGHIDVPVARDPQLAAWIAMQKTRKNSLQKHELRLLQDINFQFAGDSPKRSPKRSSSSASGPSREGSSALLEAAIAWDPNRSSQRQAFAEPASTGVKA